MKPKHDVVEDVIGVMEEVRRRKPLVHCLTNGVVKGYTANALLAMGAAPAMIEHPKEAEEFAKVADALLVNVGTLDEEQMTVMRAGISGAVEGKRPWVLDPVGVGLLRVRTRFAKEMLTLRPAVVRGNASEILALADEEGAGRGVDSGAEPEAAREAAAEVAGETGGVVLVTGRVDYAVDGEGVLGCGNGHVLMTRVTGVGCAMGGMTAACVAVTEDRLTGALAAAVWLGVAGEVAAERTQRPGTYQIALLDALDEVDAGMVRERAKILTD